MRQRDVAGLIKIYNPNGVFLVIQLLKRNLKKLFFQNLEAFPGIQLHSCGSCLFIGASGFGPLFKVMAFLRLFDANGIGAASQKGRRIRGELFKTDLVEEKTMLKEESRPRIFKKLGRRYRFNLNKISPSPFHSTLASSFGGSTTPARSKSKAYVQLGGVFPNKNVISARFFKYLLFKHFVEYRRVISRILGFLILRNLFLLLSVLGVIFSLTRVNYAVVQRLCQRYTR